MLMGWVTATARTDFRHMQMQWFAMQILIKQITGDAFDIKVL